MKKYVGKYIGFDLDGKTVDERDKKTAAAEFDRVMLCAKGALEMIEVFGCGVLALVARWR